MSDMEIKDILVSFIKVVPFILGCLVGNGTIRDWVDDIRHKARKRRERRDGGDQT